MKYFICKNVEEVQRELHWRFPCSTGMCNVCLAKQTKPTGEEQLKKIRSRLLDYIMEEDMKAQGEGWRFESGLSPEDVMGITIDAMLDWHREKVAKAKRELVEKLVEEVDDWYSLAPAYRNKSELVGKIKSLLLAELSDEEVGV